MNHAAHNKLVSFIWSIADDCLRDVYVRGKYRDVILPMVVLRRLDALLEPSKDKVLEEIAFQKNEMNLVELDDAGLKDAAGYVFYNTSKWTLRQLYETATNNQQILLANVEEYLNGFSDNVQEIIGKFNLASQVRHMAGKDVLLDVLEKFTSPYINLTPNEKEDPDGNRMAAQVFDNRDFAYYKVNIERPDRRKAQFSPEAIAPLRFDKTLKEPMQWIYAQYGEAVYEMDTLKTHEKTILSWCEDNELNLNAKNRKKLLSLDTWNKQRQQLCAAQTLMAAMGQEESNDFNQFKRDVDAALKAQGMQLAANDKKAILDAVSFYDAQAEKVIKKKVKLTGNKKAELLKHLACAESDLADFGYVPTGNAHEFITYEPCVDLRDSESVPLKGEIHRYFLAEVKPHVDEAWINLDSVKIGYEISFNKYFYRHKPLRSMEEVAADILKLEEQAEGLIADILGMK